MRMNRLPEKYWTYVIYLALAIITLAVFFQVRNFEFTNYDDDKYVSQNNHISSGLKWDNIVWVFTKAHGANWHPLTGLSHILDCQLFGLNPGRHHIINLLFHLANTLLLFTVLRQMTGAIWQSAFVAGLFALHPLHVESVAWISERKDVLSTLFWILTTAAYFYYTKNPSARRYILILILFASGLMAKPMLVTLPFVLLLLDYWPLNRFQSGQAAAVKCKGCSYLILEKVPLFVFSAVSSIITFLVQKSSGTVGGISDLPFAIRVANAVVSYWKYIVMMFWPTKLAAFYPHPGRDLPVWQVITAAIILLLITIEVLYLGKKYKYLPVGWFWYIGTLIPVIGLVQVGLQALADRYTYVPLIGLFIIIAWGTNDLLRGWKYRRVGLIAASLVIISALSICTWFQTSYWRNSQSLFEHAVKVTKGNYIAYNNLGVLLILQGKFDEAIELLENAVRAYPIYGLALKNLGIAYDKVGRSEEALEYYKRTIEVLEKQPVIDPDLPELYKIVGGMLNERFKPQEAAVYLHKAIALNPLDPQAHCHLGAVLGQTRKLDDAVAQFNEALRIDPNRIEAHCNLGYVLLNQDKFDQALEHLTKAVQLDPNAEKPHYYLAIALNEKGKTTEAITHYEKAIQLKPDWSEPMNTLAWLLATRKNAPFYNPQKALQLAKHACELTADTNIENLDTLAAAYAAVGNFPEAVTIAEKALNMAELVKNNQLANQIRERLELYKTGKPYVEPVQEQTIK